MSARRALIVDDSLSARTFLTRILQRYDLQVDGAASAEEAFEYLGSERPDVIFMDHMMPGMDGLQALSAIKQDARTAGIPVLMYTSQEDERYVSRARALGAIGVLPKQTRPDDVSRALERLRLVGAWPDAPAAAPAPRAQVPDTAASVDAPPVAPGPIDGPAPEAPAGMHLALEELLREQGIELRRFLTGALAQHAERIIDELRVRAASDAGPAVERPSLLPEKRTPSRSARLALWLGVAAAVLAASAGALWYRDSRQAPPVAVPPAVRTAPPPAAHPAAAEVPAAGGTSLAASADPPLLIAAVPFGESPLGGARVALLRAMLEQLVASGFHGSVEVRSFPGRYCMTGGEGAMAPAPAALSFGACALLGNPLNYADAAALQSADSPLLLAGQRAHGGESVDVQLQIGSADEPLVPYPMISAELSAGAWNRAAAANNRVEVRLHASP